MIHVNATGDTRGATGGWFDDVGAVARRAAGGDEAAWRDLVRIYSPLLRSIAARFRLPSDLAADAAQLTWFQLFVRMTDIRNPATIGAWLATTMRRQCLGAVSARRRENPVAEFEDWAGAPDRTELPEAYVERECLAGEVRAALERLPGRQRELLRLMATEPDMSYVEISARLDIPVGAIGPTRARALARMRKILVDDHDAGAGAGRRPVSYVVPSAHTRAAA